MTDKIYNHTEYTEQQEYEAVDVDTFLWWKKYIPTFKWLTMRPSTEAQPNPTQLHEWHVEIGWPADTPWDTEEYDYEIQLLSWMAWQPATNSNNSNLLLTSPAKSFNKKVDTEEKPEVVEEVKLPVEETSEDTSEEVSEDISEETTTDNNEEVVEEIVPDEAPEEAVEEVPEETTDEVVEQPTEEVVDKVVDEPTEVVEEVKEAVEEPSNEEENVVDTDVVNKE